MTRREAVSSIYEYSHEFIREYKNTNLDQRVIDAIIVDFINYFADTHCGITLNMSTNELRNPKNKTIKNAHVDKESICNVMEFRKKMYEIKGIIRSVNINQYYNECMVIADAENEKKAEEVIIDFINSYRKS